MSANVWFGNGIAFQSTYQRNNKKGGQKNLRCFPQCSNGVHAKIGFCGESIFVHVSKTSQSKTSNLTVLAEFCPFLDNYPQGEIQVQGVYDVPDLLAKSQKELNPLVPYYPASMITTTIQESVYGFNMSKKGWHYGWTGNKHTSDMEHVLCVYILEKVNDMQVQCVNRLVSTPFRVYCRRRAKTSGLGNEVRITAAATKHSRSFDGEDGNDAKYNKCISSPKYKRMKNESIFTELLQETKGSTTIGDKVVSTDSNDPLELYLLDTLFPEEPGTDQEIAFYSTYESSSTSPLSDSLTENSSDYDDKYPIDSPTSSFVNYDSSNSMSNSAALYNVPVSPTSRQIPVVLASDINTSKNDGSKTLPAQSSLSLLDSILYEDDGEAETELVDDTIELTGLDDLSKHVSFRFYQQQHSENVSEIENSFDSVGSEIVAVTPKLALTLSPKSEKKLAARKLLHTNFSKPIASSAIVNTGRIQRSQSSRMNQIAFSQLSASRTPTSTTQQQLYPIDLKHASDYSNIQHFPIPNAPVSSERRLFSFPSRRVQMQRIAPNQKRPSFESTSSPIVDSNSTSQTSYAPSNAVSIGYSTNYDGDSYGNSQSNHNQPPNAPDANPANNETTAQCNRDKKSAKKYKWKYMTFYVLMFVCIFSITALTFSHRNYNYRAQFETSNSVQSAPGIDYEKYLFDCPVSAKVCIRPGFQWQEIYTCLDHVNSKCFNAQNATKMKKDNDEDELFVTISFMDGNVTKVNCDGLPLCVNYVKSYIQNRPNYLRSGNGNEVATVLPQQLHQPLERNNYKPAYGHELLHQRDIEGFHIFQAYVFLSMCGVATCYGVLKTFKQIFKRRKLRRETN